MGLSTPELAPDTEAARPDNGGGHWLTSPSCVGYKWTSGSSKGPSRLGRLAEGRQGRRAGLDAGRRRKKGIAELLLEGAEGLLGRAKLGRAKKLLGG